MANEIANRSHAGLIVQLFEDGGEDDVDYSPIILGSWGFKVASMIRLSDNDGPGGPGQYQIELVQPVSGTVDVGGEFFRGLDTVTVVQSLALPNFVGAIPFVNLLTFDPGTIALNRPINLPVLAIAVTLPDGSAVDANAVLQVQLTGVPQQD